jgi:hypothetical protein
MSKLILALVLVDLAAHGAKCGTLLEASPETIKSLATSGQVDPHKDAIAAAKQRGCEVVRSAVEQAAEQRQAAQDALRVEIAQLDELLSKAADDEQKAALQRQLAEKHQALADLG